MMSVSIKSGREIEIMREAGKMLSDVHERLAKEIKPGMTTKEIDRLGAKMIKDLGATASFYNYNGYPASVCVSVNEEVVHGIPTDKHIIREGDIVSLDIGLIHKGYHSDAARTYPVGQVDEEALKLIKVTKQSFFEGVKFAKEGFHLHDISNAIAKYAESFGYGVVRDLVGHGIGKELHEDPQIPNHTQSRKGIRLKAGMTLAIEPMINAGRFDVIWLEDDWTVVSEDGSLSAHYENTVLITKDEPEILTL